MSDRLPERYVDLEPLGVGRVGPVFRARDRASDDRRVVIRVTPPDDPRAPALRAAVVRAMRARLPGFVPVFAADTSERPWVVTPELRRVEVPTSWEEVRVAALAALRALSGLHSRGLAHGDVRGSHVWRSADGGVLLSEPWAPDGSAAGDQRGVGAVIWELVTGAPPGLGTVPRVPTPADLADWLAVVLHPDPQGRFETCADAARALERVQGPTRDEPWSLPDSPWPEPGENERWQRRRRPAVGLLARECPEGAVGGLWSELVRVGDEGRPRVVCLTGEAHAARWALDDLRRRVEETGAASVFRLRYASPASDVDGPRGWWLRDLSPGLDARSAAFARRLAARGRGERASDAEARVLASVSIGARSGSGDLALRELLGELRAAAWRGRVVLVAEDAVAEGAEAFPWLRAFAEAVLDLPALVVATVDQDALGRPDVVARLAALREFGATRVEVHPRPSESAAELAPPPWADARSRDTVHLAALVGEGVSLAVVRRWAGPREDVDCWPAWTRRGAELVFEPGVRDVLRLEAEARPDVAYLHRRVARALELAGRPLDASRHALRSGDLDLAARLACRAAELADAVGAAAQSAGAAEVARAILGLRPVLPEPVLARLEVWSALDGAVRREPEAIVHLEAVFRRGVALLGLPTALAALSAHVRVPGPRAPDALLGSPVTDALLGEVSATAHQAEDLAAEQAVMLLRGAVALRRNALGPADQWFAKALARATQRADLAGAAAALLGQSTLAARTGRFDEAFELLAEAAEASRAGFDPLGEVVAGLHGAALGRHVGRTDGQRHHLATLRVSALELGRPDLAAEAVLLDAQLSRPAVDAEVRIAEVEREAGSAGWIDLAVVAAIDLAIAALQRDQQDVAYEAGRRAAAHLDAEPAHRAWGRYRLVVAWLLALRGDHTQTWQWLWSAREQGVALETDRDTGTCLTALAELAIERRWGNVARLAGQLGVDQLERLGDEVGALALKRSVEAARA